MKNQLEARLKNNRNEIPRAHRLVEDFAGEHHLPKNILHAVELSIEEHLMNVIWSGYSDPAEHEINLHLALEEDELRIEIEDDGFPFNPLEYPAPETSAPIEAKPVGGLGIHLMRKMMDALEYSRREGRNILVMRKRVR